MNNLPAGSPALPCAIEPNVPHSRTMSLLDQVLEWSPTGIVAEVTIRKDSVFFDGQFVPAWVGMEYMAQAVGAYAGLQAVAEGRPVKKGFLLGSRRLRLETDGFALGRRLKVSGERLMLDANGLGSFECRIESDGELLAHGRLNVFQPENPDAFLSEAAA